MVRQFHDLVMARMPDKVTRRSIPKAAAQTVCLWLQSMTCSSRTTAPSTPRWKRTSKGDRDRFVAGCTCVGLTISPDKTVVMHRPSLHTAYKAPRISAHGSQLKTMNNFAYLGSKRPQHKIEAKDSHWISKDSQGFDRLQTTMWNCHEGADEDASANKPIRGGQKQRYKDTLKKSLKQLRINPATWEYLAQDRPTWRRSVKTGSAIYEANRIATANAKRAARGSPAPRTRPRPRPFQYIPILITCTPTTAFTTNTTVSNGDSLVNCPQLDRTFASRIGLVGHFESIVQTVVNLCLENQHTAKIAASTVLAHLLIAWAYSVTCVSMTAEFTAMPTTPAFGTASRSPLHTAASAR
ncbi:unnamed protein product [Schistocephalus solidus]|uniref:Reverse transcriptase domain-containing protein n=1 Tax=Schistocephalus solidus TaxID=70667 RepID=A0A183SY01_SCHSO|nr:unnamed protein product [Schistocephalus solidus]